MALATKRFDAAKYFTTVEAQQRLINDALQSGHAGYIAKAFGVVAKAKGMSEVARETGLSRQALYASLAEDGNPSLDTLLKVSDALGIEFRAEFRSVEERHSEPA
jgi:probable addiction module antidote protein